MQIVLGLGLKGFKASAGWMTKWKKRHAVGMNCRMNSSQRVSADYTAHELIQHFRASTIKIHKAKDITPTKIVNMDQTMCRFDMPGTRTNNLRGTKTIRIEKNGFTIALCTLGGRTFKRVWYLLSKIM